MNKTWSLPSTLYTSFHRWPQMVVFALVGCLIGWILALIWPSPYRAEAQIYVGLNPYRSYTDSRFLALAKPRYSNIDNYKYWQLSQLQTAILAGDFIDRTLADLQAEDPYWNTVSPDDLQEMLSTEWRSAGLWTLVAEHPQADRAEQAVNAWSSVVVSRVNEAVEAARTTFMLDEEIQARQAVTAENRAKIDAYRSTKNKLLQWQQSAANLPAIQPLDQNERWRVLGLAAQAADFTPAWSALLKEQPPAEADAQVYVGWIDHVLVQVDVEMDRLESSVKDQEAQLAEVEAQYRAAADESLAFSPNIEIQGLEQVPAEATRPVAVLALIGAVAGLLSWLIFRLAAATHNETAAR